MKIPFDKCLVIDFEASGLHPESYPTEIAWANPYPAPDKAVITDHLIAPASDWTFWDPEAEKITGIARHHLELHGEFPAKVLGRLIEAAEGRVILTDAPRWDAFWLQRLILAAEREAGAMGARFQFADLTLLLDQLAEERLPATSPNDALMMAERQLKLIDASIEKAKLSFPPTHRAGDDVRNHLETIRFILES